MPVLRVGVGLEALAAHVEPDRRVEGGLLGHEQVRQLIVEDGGVFGRGEVAVGQTPVADGLGDAADELADAGFAVGRSDLAMEVLASDDVGRGHRPVDGRLDVFLLEDAFAVGVGNGGGAVLPLEFVIRRDAGLREKALEFKGCSGFAGSAGRGLGGC